MVELRVNGNIYKWWKSATVNRSMDSIASDFTVSIAEDKEYYIEPGDRVQVYVNDNLVATCIVDSKEISYDAASHSITISGRSLTGQLVDGYEHHTIGTWKNITPDKLILDLVDEYGINVSTEVELTKKIEQFTVEHGETTFHCLERIARNNNFLLMDNPEGALVLTKASKVPTLAHLIYGHNILSCHSKHSIDDIYSWYIVKGHQPKLEGNSRHQLEDHSVKLFRPIVLISSTPVTDAECKTRAYWEAKIRKARSHTATYTVPGWEYEEKKLWAPNMQVFIDDPKTNRFGHYLVTEVSYQTGNGELTELTVMPPEAFDELG